jgi:Tol biopolymer transport system component
MDKKIRPLLFAFLAFSITSCTLPLLPDNTNNGTKINNIRNPIGNSENEFSVKTVTVSYLKRKLSDFITNDKGAKLVKEINYGRFKHILSLSTALTDDPLTLQTVLDYPEVQHRIEIDPGFAAYLNSLIPDSNPTEQLGRIAFVTYRNGGGGGFQDIYVMNADGSNPVNITALSSDPALAPENGLKISPDKTKIFFMSVKDGLYKGFIINTDGSGLKDLGEISFGNLAEWSPDSTRVAFLSSRNGEFHPNIYIANASDGITFKLMNDPNLSVQDYLHWSPNSTKIAFKRVFQGKYLLYVVDALEGSVPIDLTTGLVNIEYAENAQWSPDGTKLAFESYVSVPGTGLMGEISVINASGGSASVNLTNDNLDDYSPTWSPDGTKIAYDSYGDYNGTGNENGDICIISPNGAGKANLTNSTTENSNPVWSPDSSKIAFHFIPEGGDQQIYVMNHDGTNPVPVSDPAVRSHYPVWSPEGSKLLFASNSNSDIYIANPDGSGFTNLTPDSEADEFPFWIN